MITPNRGRATSASPDALLSNRLSALDAGEGASCGLLLKQHHPLSRLPGFRDLGVRDDGPPEPCGRAGARAQVSNAVEKTYQRGDLIDKRRLLMEDWATFCAAPRAYRGGKVVTMRGGAP